MAMTARTVVQKYLMGSYPAGRDELVNRARRQGADGAVLSLIRKLKDQQFESPHAVERALGERH